jgi:hypothetical protein
VIASQGSVNACNKEEEQWGLCCEKMRYFANGGIYIDGDHFQGIQRMSFRS